MVWKEQKDRNKTNVFSSSQNYLASKYYTQTEHDYTTRYYTPPQKHNNKPSSQHFKEQSGIVKAIEHRLSLEAEKVRYSDIFDTLKIDLESIQSFNEFARHLHRVNPICNPDAVDTADKLVTLLGI